MNRKINIIDNVLSMLLTVIATLAVVVVSTNLYASYQVFTIILWIALGAVIGGFLNAVVHELGHLISGRRNGFKLIEIAIWFFKWRVDNGKIRFSFVLPLAEAGYTTMVPTSCENVAKRYKKMTLAGSWASLGITLCGAVAFFFKGLPLPLFCLWAMVFPMGVYYFFGALLPMTANNVRNDGAVAYGINNNDDVAKVTINLLCIQSELYNGKTPSEIDEALYFELPQLKEDLPEFAMLLNARYNYYLDKGDYENAKAVTERLLSIEDYLQKEFVPVIKADALYNSCTFDQDEEKMDDLMYELENYLNKVNSVTNVRIKLAYLIRIGEEQEVLEMFFKKGFKDASKHPIKGLGAMEEKLLNGLKKEF